MLEQMMTFNLAELAQIHPLIIALAAIAINIVMCSQPVMSRTLARPIAFTGRTINALEVRYNRPEYTNTMRFWDGFAVLVVLIIAAGGIGLALHFLAVTIPYGWVIEALAMALILAHRVHIDQSLALAAALGAGIEQARATLALVASRDSHNLSETDIVRAGIEDDARTLNSGLVAPIVYFLLFGLPGMLIYKVVATVSDMIDEHTPYSACFGAPASRLARWLTMPIGVVTMLVVALGAIAPSTNPLRSIKIALRDGRKYSDKSAGGMGVAAFAGALGIMLGGRDQTVKGLFACPLIGDGAARLDRGSILKSRWLFIRACIALAICLAACFWLGAPMPLALELFN